MNLIGLLTDKGLLTPADRSTVEAEIAKKRTVEDVLGEHGISIEDALKVAGEAYGLPTRILGDPPASQDVFGYIPIDSARHYGFVPLDMADGALEVGITDPDNIEALDALAFISGRIGVPYKIFLITKGDFDRVLEAYQNLSGEVGKALSEYNTVPKQTAAAARAGASALSPLEAAAAGGDEALVLSGPSEALKEDAPVTKIVSTILRYAIEGHASDIHIEPAPDQDARALPHGRPAAHLARAAGESARGGRRPHQDPRQAAARREEEAAGRPLQRRSGQAAHRLPRVDLPDRLRREGGDAHPRPVGRHRDARLGRLLHRPVRGGQRDNEGAVRHHPHRGPTGSGKSTTLFAMLSALNRETANVVSLEDPIEYEIPGVSQSQVRPEIGYTFASGLRSILRQDPDVIMVGEIRDKETAALAVQAALTGHLVFSTIHTNTAAGAIPRLIDMGVDPFLIAPTLVAVIGQRLVRRLCEGAGDPFPITASIKEFLDRDFADLPEKYRAKLPPFKQFYHAKPTADCPSGTRGRIGTFEILRMNKELEQIVLEAPVEESVYAAARAGGMLTMREDAIEKALAGVIPFEEVNTLGGELFPAGDEA